MNTGAVVMGRHAFSMADDPNLYAVNYEYQVPIFVITHKIPEQHPKETELLTFTFVNDGVVSAITQAKAASGIKDVVIIGGPDIARQCMRSGLVDELHIDIMPVILCQGMKLFDDVCAIPIHLERIAVVELPFGRTHLRFRIIKES